MAHVIGTKMLVRDYNEFGILELTTGETEWMEQVSVKSNNYGDGQRQYRLGGVQHTSPRSVFEAVARTQD